MEAGQSEFMVFVRAIAAGDVPGARAMLAHSPLLATTRLERGSGATRESASDWFLQEVGHYVYAGDTALHVAAAGYHLDIVRALLDEGAAVAARNRRGAEPLHYAADGQPGSANWHPDAQAATVTCLIRAGADPDALDRSGVAPLHRAVRTRCAAAVAALLDGGADPRITNKRGSTPLDLAGRTTGRGGSGTPEAKAQQEQILRLLGPR